MRNLRSNFRATAGQLLAFDWRKLEPFERDCVRADLTRHHEYIAWTVFWIGVAFNLVFLPLDTYIAEPVTLPVLSRAHLIIIPVIMGYLPLRKFIPGGIRAWVYFCTLIHAALYAYVVHVVCADAGMVVAKSVAAYLGITAFFMVICPYGGVVPVITALFFTALAAYAAGPGDVARRWVVLYFMTMVMALIFLRMKSVINRRSSLLDARAKLAMAPAHVVLKAASSGRTIEDLFHPEMRSCACIALNWANYDSLAFTVPPMDLAKVLDDYHERCQRLLRECVPDDAHFVDTLGDEVFIVVFDSQNDGESAFLRAFTFARMLLAEHAMRREDQIRLDVGISYGEVLVGVMGPRGHKKTTGLGESPGRAARLKTACRVLREQLGDVDRIVLDERGLAVVKKQTEVRMLPLPPDIKIRDVDLTKLHFWQVEDKAA